MANKKTVVGFQHPGGLAIPRPWYAGDVLVTPDGWDVYHERHTPWMFSAELSRYSSVVNNGGVDLVFSDTRDFAVARTDRPCIHRLHPGIGNYTGDYISAAGAPVWATTIDASGTKIMMGVADAADSDPYLNAAFNLEHISVYYTGSLWHAKVYGSVNYKWLDSAGAGLSIATNGGYANWTSSAPSGWSQASLGYGPMFTAVESGSYAVAASITHPKGSILMDTRMYQSANYVYLSMRFRSNLVIGNFGCGYAIRWFTTVLGV